jgi:HK97 family phage major capsid protein
MPQSVKDYLQADVNRKLAEAKRITEAADAAARSMTDDERKSVEGLLKDVQGLKGRIQEIEDNENIQRAIDELRGPSQQPVEEVKGFKTIGEAFVKSDAYQALKKTGTNGRWATGPIEIPLETLGSKATVTTSASPVVEIDTRPGILGFPQRRLTIADLIATGTTDSNTVRYVEETTNTNAAAAVTEGDLKPESTIVFTNRDESVRKIATFLPVSDEMLEDVAQLQSYLNERLRLFVQLQEEAQLLTGSGTAPNLRGILNRTGILTQAKGTDTTQDAIHKAMTSIRTTSFLEPDGIVMHPNDWQDVRLGKDANGQYYGGGPFTGPYGQNGIARDNIWGMPVVVTPAITEGTALVGAFRLGAQMFRKGGLTVEASNSHSDFFQRNLTAIRAEERLALAVYRPTAFATVTGV